MDTLSQQITASLRASSLPPPSQPWLAALVTSRSPPPPLQSLVATARARLLAADLTSPGLLDPSCLTALVFPFSSSSGGSSGGSGSGSSTAVGGVEVRETRLPRDVVVQVLDIENLSRSRWEQVEDLEAVERGEFTRGREVVRLPLAGDDDGDGDESLGREEGSDVPLPSGQATQGAPGGVRGPGTAVGGGGGGGGSAAAAAAGKNATHRLVLQDCRGQKVYGLELRRIDKIGVGKTSIGEKMLVNRGTVVARGTLLLDPSNCRVLGGKVEAWHKAWTEGRLARLKEGVGGDSLNGGDM